jgi:hypothetical protein
MKQTVSYRSLTGEEGGTKLQAAVEVKERCAEVLLRMNLQARARWGCLHFYLGNVEEVGAAF